MDLLARPFGLEELSYSQSAFFERPPGVVNSRFRLSPGRKLPLPGALRRPLSAQCRPGASTPHAGFPPAWVITAFAVHLAPVVVPAQKAGDGFSPSPQSVEQRYRIEGGDSARREGAKRSTSDEVLLPRASVEHGQAVE